MNRYRAFIPSLGQILPVKTIEFDYRGIASEITVENRQPIGEGPGLSLSVEKYPASSVKLLQSTGHKDSVGIEIFEGDILFSVCPHDSRPVFSESWCFVYWKGFSWRTGTFRRCSCGCGKDSPWSAVPVANKKNIHSARIVGNIFTHPGERNKCRSPVNRERSPDYVVEMVGIHPEGGET